MTDIELLDKITLEIAVGEYFGELAPDEWQKLLTAEDQDECCEDFLNSLEDLDYSPCVLSEHEDKTIEDILGNVQFLARCIFKFIKGLDNGQD